MKIHLVRYGISWIVVKYSNFAEGWDTGTISVIALAMMFGALMLFDIGKSMLRNGKHGILYAIIMIGGNAYYWIAGEMFGKQWYLDFQNDTVNNTFAIVSVSGVCIMLLKLIRMILTREEE